MTKAVVTTRTWYRGSASVLCLGSSGDGLATVSNRDQREEGHWNYPALDRRGRARGRLAALVLVGVGATATACRTDALPTPRPLPAPIVAAEEGALASLTRADGVRKICEGRAAAEAASAERPVDGLGAPIRRREKLTDDNNGRDSFPGLVSDVAKAWRGDVRVSSERAVTNEGPAFLATLGSRLGACDGWSTGAGR